MKTIAKPGLQMYRTDGGAVIYRLPLEVFPGMWAFAYLVLVDHYRVLIDTGSGFGSSNNDLEEGFKLVSQERNERLDFSSLSHIFITHGHIDHHGGLAYLVERTSAEVGIHELDRRVITSYEERVLITTRRLGAFLAEAGVSSENRTRLLEMYGISKALFKSVRVDFGFEARGMALGPFRFLHVPGHCAGQVVIMLHDVLFSGDHILAEITPHQAPEQLTLSTGLGHYLESLQAVLPLDREVRLTLGGHRAPIEDLAARIREIQGAHQDRLDETLAYLASPHTIAEISSHLFGEVTGYSELLALEEAGAHVEYLYQRGALQIDNISELESAAQPIALKYVRYQG